MSIGKKKLIVDGLLVIVAAFIVAGVMTIKAEAKGIAELKTLLASDPLAVDTTGKCVTVRNSVTIDGYDLQGYKIQINAANVTIKNCTNVLSIDVPPGYFGSGAVISNNTITVIGNNGIGLIGVSNAKVTGNTISDSAGTGNASIYLDNCVSAVVEGNTITNSDHYGITVIHDDSSVIKNNVIKNSANGTLSKALHGDGILVNENCNRTEIIGNTIDTVKSGFADWGNGLIVAKSSNVKVNNNIIVNAGNHGIQVTYQAQNITLSGNTVTNSGYQGVSVSRGASVNMENNTVSNNVGNGIVYDGNETSYGIVKGNISNNICKSNTGFGLYFMNCNVTVTGNKIETNTNCGIGVDAGCTTIIKSNTITDNGNIIGVSLTQNSVNTVEANKISLSSVNPEGIGIAIYNSASATINNNTIVNYGNRMIYDAPGTSVTQSNNKDFGVTPEQRAAIESFAERLYSVCLDRGSDIGGINYWSDELESGAKTGSEAAYGFVFSDEFVAKNYCNTCFLEHLYNAFMGRPSDSDGMNYWLDYMNAGHTREDVFNCFVGSEEFLGICDSYGINVGVGINLPEYGTVPTGPCSSCGAEDGVTAFVKRMYVKVLDRPAEEGGLSYHTGNLWAHTKSGKEVAGEFIFSEEFESKNYDNSTYLEYLYVAFMGRPSDVGGKNHWLNQMENDMSRRDVFNSFASSEEFQGICKSYGIKPF